MGTDADQKLAKSIGLLDFNAVKSAIRKKADVTARNQVRIFAELAELTPLEQLILVIGEQYRLSDSDESKLPALKSAYQILKYLLKKIDAENPLTVEQLQVLNQYPAHAPKYLAMQKLVEKYKPKEVSFSDNNDVIVDYTRAAPDQPNTRPEMPSLPRPPSPSPMVKPPLWRKLLRFVSDPTRLMFGGVGTAGFGLLLGPWFMPVGLALSLTVCEVRKFYLHTRAEAYLDKRITIDEQGLEAFELDKASQKGYWPYLQSWAQPKGYTQFSAFATGAGVQYRENEQATLPPCCRSKTKTTPASP